MNIKVITKKNLHELDMFNEFNVCIVYGKGPTFRNDIEKQPKELRCAINQACNYLDNVDMVCCNDAISIYDIDKNKLKNIKFLLIPEYLHLNNEFNVDGYWEKSIYNHVKDYFNGYYIIYNLNTNENSNENLITLDTAITSTNNLIEFISKFTNIKKIITYGFGVLSNQKYSKYFTDNKEARYDEKRINNIRETAIENCIDNNVDIIIN